MSYYRNLILIFGFSVFAFFGVLIAINKIEVGSAPFHRGRVLVRFSPEQLKMARREEVALDALKDPFVSAGPAHSSYPPIALSDAVPDVPSVQKPKVSMILLAERRNIAIVDGQIVKEGDRTEKNKVLRIEKDRVLLTSGKGDRTWIRVPETMMREPNRADQNEGLDRPSGKGNAKKGTGYDQD